MSIVAVLSQYPEGVVKRVTDPRTGVQRICKWLPTVAEITDACEKEMKPIYDHIDRERREYERTHRLPPPSKGPREVRAATIARMRQKFPLAFPEEVGPTDPVKAQRELEQLCREKGVDVSSVPDRPGCKSADALGDVKTGWHERSLGSG